VWKHWQHCVRCAKLVKFRSWNRAGRPGGRGASGSTSALPLVRRSLPDRRRFRLKAGMAKLADAADLKSADSKELWGFKSPSRYHSQNLTFMASDLAGERLRRGLLGLRSNAKMWI
jgi:hypothetical protein